ncbi:helix-turn-helix domain-containing protein [Paenibacillus sp. JNUCC31]|uniref:helix-turn-helix domain-containing protein n=1 Tax=Paenibacillus sp. JNUCC-31 TaxID=2777983 RepID=UPI001E458DB4|nr:helix-turn-helix domain-containing protein [Paenibacillus sp. JNUCC-31]
MIVFGILLSTLPILLTGIAAFIYSSKQSELHRAQANKQLLIQMQTNVEHKLATVSYMLDQAVRSPDTLHSLTSSSSSAQGIGPLFAEKLQTEFKNMRSWEPLMDITLVNQTQDWLIDHAGLYLNTDFPLTLPMKDLLSNTLTSGWQLTPSSIFNNEERIMNSGCIYHIALARSIPNVDASSDAALIAGIPACSLQKPLEEDSLDSSAAGLIILNREQRIMVHPDPSYIGQPLATAGIWDNDSRDNFSELLSMRALAASSGQREVRIADTDYSLSYTHSSLKGWTYILISPTNILTHEYVQIGLHTMYISVAMLLLSLLLSWIGSRRMHIPIRQLLIQLGDKRWSKGHYKTISIFHMDEFEQIRAGVSQLSASQSQLENKLNQYKLQIHTHFLINLLLGKNAPATIHDSLGEYGYESHLKEWQQIAVVTVQADLLNHTKYNAKDRDLLLFAIQNILEESILAEQQLLPVVYEHAVVTILGTSEQDHVRFSKQLYTLTEQLQHQIREILNLQVSIGFSQPHTSLLQIPQAYTEALEALKHRMKLGTGIIFQFEAIDHRTPTWSLHYPESLEYKLIQAIQSADEAYSASLLHQLLQVLFGVECTPEEYQVALNRLLTHILQIMQESGIRLGQISQGHGSIFNELHALQYAAEVEQWFNDHIINPIILILKERQYAQYQHISEKMIAMVQQEYDKDLTLEECASRLHYNANYLSSVFRKETGCAFSEYLTKYRFSMAKKWLDESDLTVKDIAARLCYNNPQNFIRSFRKWEGITPGQYRERKQKADLCP